MGRTRFLALLIACAAAIVLAPPTGALSPPAAAAAVAPFSRPLVIPKTLTGSNITLTAALTPVQILPGAPTLMWTYNGTFPGPTIRRPTGQPTHLTLINRLPATAGAITLHNHGNHSTSASDGQPDAFLAEPGGGTASYDYSGREDGANERGALQWYHDHRMDVTGRNVWMGLAGMYLIDDPADPQTLPRGGFDVPLMIVDRSFDANNQLSYRFDRNGVSGNRILVNGVPQPYFNVGDRRYRLRILNASNFRPYELALSTGQAFTQVGTESGLLPKPVKRTRIVIGPAERVDVIVDFAGRLGQKIVLQNLAATGALGQIMQFRVTKDLVDDSRIPATLRPLPTFPPGPTVARTFEFGQARVTNDWTINGQTFDAARIDAQPVLGQTEIWTLRNRGGSNHFIHIHEVDQQLISRNGAAPPAGERMKETWNISAGQTVVVKLRFTDNAGTFVFHCHILEHEDAGMMGQIEVVPPASADQ
jgi:FtsP/CotA-like multicopper oxidase with cupredoxin domain